MTPRPLFLLSPPRSGSTLLQRMLAAHEGIATVSEPWILLPPLTALSRTGAFATWHQWSLGQALTDFCAELPGGERDYLDAVARFAGELYARVAPDAQYFLDKTPRYHLVVDRLLEAFGEDASFVWLWRNPLAIAASYLDSWGHGRWNLHYFAHDLYNGVANLADAFETQHANAVVVHYEQLVANPAEELARILSGLGLSAAPGIHERFTEVELRGHEGDRVGSRRYSAVSTQPLGQWRRTFANPIRRRWAARYLAWLGDDRLRLMGYDRVELLSQLEREIAPGRVALDSLQIMRGSAYTALKSRLMHVDARVWR